ncbi:DNA-processing protein DprA [Micrococcoides hystricis]|uniref:DNA-processing protein DprA n=1 Tax=Micrococcoides hystricis TaxID=1572761 RepID=A0ABV6PC63_9MICC
MTTCYPADLRPDLEPLRRIRVELAHIIEPEDWIGMQLIHHLGPEQAHRLVTDTSLNEHRLSKVLHDHGAVMPQRSFAATVQAALRRWNKRITTLADSEAHAIMRGVDAALLIPEDPRWPQQLADLGADQPVLLWVRGDPEILNEHQVAVVGARAATPYGTAVAEDLVGMIIRAGHHVTSGGAYGIDAASHHAALRTSANPRGGKSTRNGSRTIAVLAGGIDRYYPAGNRDLLRRIAQNGAVISEVLPGRPPSRYRFLSRNRIIAALSSLIVVVEAQHRSGALNTAHHGLNLGRTVAAVPGSVFATSSAGCHRLIQETPTELIYRAEDVQRLLDVTVTQAEQHEESLDLTELMVLACLPVSKHVGIDGIVDRTGLPVHQILAILTQLAASGYAVERDQLWRSTGRTSHSREQHDNAKKLG